MGTRRYCIWLSKGTAFMCYKVTSNEYQHLTRLLQTPNLVTLDYFRVEDSVHIMDHDDWACI